MTTATLDDSIDAYTQGVTEGVLRIKECRSCTLRMHPRRMLCSGCGSTDVAWTDAVGRGHVYSFSTIGRFAPTPELRATSGYSIGLVLLEEGVYFFGRLVNDDDGSIRIGAPVAVDFRTLEQGVRLPVFVLDTSELEEA